MSKPSWFDRLKLDGLKLDKLIPQPAKFRDPYYRFTSIQELQAAAALGVRIDVNQASLDDWLRLPGLSIHQARLLVELRQSGLEFYALEDLAAALGLPVARLQPLAPMLQFCCYEALPPVNPNDAPLAKLMQIPGLEAEQAVAIVQERQRGRYRNLLDLQQRLHWSAETTASLMHYLRLG